MAVVASMIAVMTIVNWLFAMSSNIHSVICFPMRMNGICMQKMVRECFPICRMIFPMMVFSSNRDIYITAMQPKRAANRQTPTDIPYSRTERLMPLHSGNKMKYMTMEMMTMGW